MEASSSTPCPQCRRGNSPDNRFCGACGAAFESGEQLVRWTEERPITARRALLPAELKPVGRALAVGLATLAAEAGLAWLRRRAEGSDRASLPVARGTKSVIPEPPIYQSFEEVHAWVLKGDFESRIFAQRAVVRSIRTTNPTDGQR